MRSFLGSHPSVDPYKKVATDAAKKTLNFENEKKSIALNYDFLKSFGWSYQTQRKEKFSTGSSMKKRTRSVADPVFEICEVKERR